jgi:hypothetical protein
MLNNIWLCKAFIVYSGINKKHKHMKKSIAFNFALVTSFAASISGMLLSIIVNNSALLAVFSVVSIAIVAAAVTVWCEK